MKFLEPRERDTVSLRSVEVWEYHEIAVAVQLENETSVVSVAVPRDRQTRGLSGPLQGAPRDQTVILPKQDALPARRRLRISATPRWPGELPILTIPVLPSLRPGDDQLEHGKCHVQRGE